MYILLYWYIFWDIYTGIHTASNRRSIVTGGKGPVKFLFQESKLSCNNMQSCAGVGKHYPHNCVIVTIILCFYLDGCRSELLSEFWRQCHVCFFKHVCYYSFSPVLRYICMSALHLVLYCLVVKSSCGSGVIGDDINDTSSILATLFKLSLSIYLWPNNKITWF